MRIDTEIFLNYVMIDHIVKEHPRFKNIDDIKKFIKSQAPLIHYKFYLDDYFVSPKINIYLSSIDPYDPDSGYKLETLYSFEINKVHYTLTSELELMLIEKKEFLK